ncbi:MBL fold metallo-hydrolase [Calidifontimicrobium sp. SYSU G02091]|uniref:MBL fold metallo-hydrolase n=1 Tax=Calidifontimicrobium sp. SYSU G02091 TaxID=2926421 RepID=UPI001F52C0AD|nr:MBL fold metallo-hydrolase [Calidifontimicrobium sp. SYSU G02091]MCI1191914.1 MBL fold metallo-hydrolase [Calidifontimicrobium sp. SYSU G02091]
MTDRALPHDDYLASAGRRRLLRAGAGSLTALAAGGLFGGRVAVAQAVDKPADIPVVDRVAIRVVTDSYHHAFEPPRTLGSLQVQRLGFAVAPRTPPRRTLQNEWGLSLHVESARGDETRQVLLDFGYTPEALLNNLLLCGIDASKLDAIALSHGHFDHFGGMVGFLEANRGKLKAGLPFYLGSEECFCTRELNVPGEAGSFGALDRDAIRHAGLTVTFAERPSVLASHGFTTGTIPRASFERVLAPTRMTVGMQGALGCAPERLPEAKRALTTAVPDDFEHEQAIAYHLRGRGLVVMTSCGHRGIVNSVRKAMQVAGTDKVHAILGGFHLAPHAPEYQRQTLAELKAINPDFLIPMHCSGEAFIAMVQAEMPERFVRSSTGTRFIFSA